MAEENAKGAVRMFLAAVEYAGDKFWGWQLQGEGRSVQGELEKAAALLCAGDSVIRMHGASRTDKGVHALAQAVGFTMPCVLSTEELMHSLNSRLPSDVVVHALHEMPTVRPRFARNPLKHGTLASLCRWWAGVPSAHQTHASFAAGRRTSTHFVLAARLPSRVRR
jgi:hypothetical protein